MTEAIIKPMSSERKETVLTSFGLTEKEWDRSCALNPELSMLKPEMLMRHCQENAEGMGFDRKTWIALCQKVPQLYEINLATLEKHAEENAALLRVSKQEWIKICKSEPGLFIYSKQALEKGLHDNPAALGISAERWRDTCIRRGVLLTYRPETLVHKLEQFRNYVLYPKTLLESQKAPSETMVQTLKGFKGMFLDRSKVLDAFLRHPNDFASSPEKMAYSFAYLDRMVKAFKVNVDPYRFLSYIDLSVEPNLQMHYLYACLNRHKGKSVSVTTLAGERKGIVKQALLGVIPAKENGSMPESDKEVLAAYPCPVLMALKQYKSR